MYYNVVNENMYEPLTNRLIRSIYFMDIILQSQKSLQELFLQNDTQLL